MSSTAVLDANVLYSAALRDFLLRLAVAKLFIPFWSNEIQDEWTRNVLKNDPNTTRESLEWTCGQMNAHFPNGLVHGYESLIPTLKLPDLNDRHVLAAAIYTKANSIVTRNLRHFPKTALLPYGIVSRSPDEFVFGLIQKDWRLVLVTARKHRASLTRPSKTVDEYLATLEKQQLPQTVAFLREHRDNL